MQDWAGLNPVGSGGDAGTITPSMRLLIDTHAALLMDFDEDVSEAEVLGAAFLEDEMPVAMKTGALDAVFARIEKLGEPSPQQKAAAAAGSAIDEILGLPEPLREVALNAMARTTWKFAAPGIRSLPLDMGDGSHTEILRIEPGAAAPRHDHHGFEYTLVVKGAFRDGDARYGVGDLSVRKPGDVHRPVGEPGEVCFSLAVADGPVALTGALGLIQRLLTRH